VVADLADLTVIAEQCNSAQLTQMGKVEARLGQLALEHIAQAAQEVGGVAGGRPGLRMINSRATCPLPGFHPVRPTAA